MNDLKNWYDKVFKNRLYTKKNMKHVYTCYIFKDKRDKNKYLIKYPQLLHSKNNIFIDEENVYETNLVGQRILEVYLVSSNFESLIKEIVEEVQETNYKSDVVLLECEKIYD